MEKIAQILEISNKKFPNFTESFDNFQKVAKNIEGFLFLLLLLFYYLHIYYVAKFS
jgi:hypothetical protein